MELEDKSLVEVAQIEQQQEANDLNKSANIDLLNSSENDMEGAVIIYDTETQQQQIIKVVTNLDKSDASDKSSDDFENLITLHASTSDVKTEVQEEEINSPSNVDNSKNDTAEKHEEPEVDSDDDETIATFVTSTGQQLALYAVEDSDEIFAVALYDESGEPPTNFHFLLKADVERLIGEGAVKTVKKPTAQANKEAKSQIKKEEIIFEKIPDTKDIKPVIANEIPPKKVPEVKPQIVEVPKVQKPQETRVQKTQEPRILKLQEPRVQKLQEPRVQKLQETRIQKPQETRIQKPQVQKIEQKRPVITKTTNQQINRNISYTKQTTPIRPKPPVKVINSVPEKRVLPKTETSITYVVTNENQSYIIDQIQEEIDSDAEILEQSTVQYILCDGDPSDTELTFDELQASLQSFKMGKPAPNFSKTNKLSEATKIEKKEIITKFSPSSKKSTNVVPILSPKREPTTIYRTYKNPKKARMTNNLLQAHRKIKKEVEDPSYNDFSTFEDEHHSADESKNMNASNSSNTENVSSAVKVKRSRKQQLTVVNRTDSEIIIQPASVYSEEEEIPIIAKRRGRRKKKLLADPDYNPRKPLKKGPRRSMRSVEVIDIDVDENDRLSTGEIALDGNKGKGSSDKENDVISVGDSDEEDERPIKKVKKLSKPMMQCSHCMRNFRKRKVLEKHVQACPKSPSNIQRMEEQKKNKDSGEPKKFKCKSCDDTFDVAVALARHVRVVHSPRKRGKQARNNWMRDDRSETTEMEDSMEESSPEPEPGPRRRGRPRIKRSISKENSPTSDIELKLDSSGEPPPEPRKRGRPPSKKNVQKEMFSDLEDKNTSMIEPISSEPRKRGRPRKRSPSIDRSLDQSDLDDKNENAIESFIQIPKKRGRPSKKNVSLQEERSATPDADVSSEPKKKGRPVKHGLSKDDFIFKDRSSSPEVAEKLESIKQSRSKDDSSTPEPEEKKKRAIMDPPKKRKLSKDDFLICENAEIMKPEVTIAIIEKPPIEIVSKEDKINKKENSAEGNIISANEIKMELEECLAESRKRNRSSKDDSSTNSEIKSQKLDTIENSEVDLKESKPFKKKKFSKVQPSVSEESSLTSPAESNENKDVSSTNDNLINSEQENKIESTEEQKIEESDSADEIELKFCEPESSQASKSHENKSTENNVSEIVQLSVETSKEDDQTVTSNSQNESIVESSKDEDERRTYKDMENKIENSPLSTRRTGRLSKDESSKMECKVESSDEPVVETQRKSRFSIDEPSKDKRSATPDAQCKVESSEDSPSKSRKRGRPSKSDDEKVTSPGPENKAESSEESLVEPRKRGRPSRFAIEEKSECSVTENKVESTEEFAPELRKSGRLSKTIVESNSASPASENKVESSEDSSAETRKSGRLNKSTGEEKISSAVPESKVESSDESSIEPRRRGRAGKAAVEDKPTSPEQDSKVESGEESTVEPRRGRSNKFDNKTASAALENIAESSEESSSEPRKRGRSSRVNIDEKTASPVPENSAESSEEFSMEPRKRGRPSRVNIDDKTASPVPENSAESSEEFSMEPRKRGRPSRVNIDDKIASPVPENSAESSEESSVDPRKRGKLTKDKSSNDDQPETSEAESKIESSTDASESRRRGRSSKSSSDAESKVESSTEAVSEISRRKVRSAKDASSVIVEEETDDSQDASVDSKDKVNIQKNLPGSKRAWKVKKLNCADCGKWFSSAAALTTHCLQHRTKKKSGQLFHRCLTCKKLIAVEAFSKHLATIHGKPTTSMKKGSVSLPLKSRAQVAKPVTKEQNVRSLRSSNQ